MSARMRRIVALLLVVFIGAHMVYHHAHERSPGNRAAAGTPVTPDVLRLGQLSLLPCAIGRRVDEGLPTLSAYCNEFSVPEDWSSPNGRHITLHVAVVRAETDKPGSDLITFLDGGPGGAATEDYGAVRNGFQPLLGTHNILLVDQRGTGSSNAFNCQPTDAKDKPERFKDVDSDAAVADLIKSCVDRLASRVAPQFYATTDAVRDLEAVRVALGSPKLDVIGISYGTRMAQQYAGRYPDAVRSMVLDGPVPNRLALLSEHARNLESALRAEFARCTADARCAKTYGDPYATLYRVRDRLAAKPPTIDVRDPVNFEPLHLTLTADDLAAVVRLYAYSPITAALMPLMLQQADEGNYAPLLGQKKWVTDDLSEHLSSGVEASILCAEDVDLLTPRPEDDHTMMGNRSIVRSQRMCQLWPHGTRPANFHEPLVSSIPTLVLAGELDPVTPPSYGTEIVQHLAHARLLTVKGQGHSVIGDGCMPSLVRRFIENLDPAKLDARCLDRLGAPAAYIDFNGAAP